MLIYALIEASVGCRDDGPARFGVRDDGVRHEPSGLPDCRRSHPHLGPPEGGRRWQ